MRRMVRGDFHLQIPSSSSFSRYPRRRASSMVWRRSLVRRSPRRHRFSHIRCFRSLEGSFLRAMGTCSESSSSAVVLSWPNNELHPLTVSLYGTIYDCSHERPKHRQGRTDDAVIVQFPGQLFAMEEVTS